MKASVDGKIHDTDAAERQAEFITYSNTEHELYRTTDGEFFLVLSDYVLDGRRLGPLESLEQLAPELCEPPHDLSALTEWPNWETDDNERQCYLAALGAAMAKPTETEKAKLHRLRERERRLRREDRLVLVTNNEALKWCVKTQIPESLRGYLLDCL